MSRIQRAPFEGGGKALGDVMAATTAVPDRASATIKMDIQLSE